MLCYLSWSVVSLTYNDVDDNDDNDDNDDGDDDDDDDEAFDDDNDI